MAVIKVKPTSPGRRAVTKVVHKHLHKGAPEASLLEPHLWPELVDQLKGAL